MDKLTNKPYGEGDASYQAAGGKQGLKKLADDFYDAMASEECAKTILHMHPDDLDISRDKLALFLCGWLGGPRLFKQKYGTIHLPIAHKHLMVDAAARDAWLHCMSLALEQQDYDTDFKAYMLAQLKVPAQRIHKVNL